MSGHETSFRLDLLLSFMEKCLAVFFLFFWVCISLVHSPRGMGACGLGIRLDICMQSDNGD